MVKTNKGTNKCTNDKVTTHQSQKIIGNYILHDILNIPEREIVHRRNEAPRS